MTTPNPPLPDGLWWYETPTGQWERMEVDAGKPYRLLRVGNMTMPGEIKCAVMGPLTRPKVRT